MNIVSNFIFHCDNYDVNRAFVKFPESADLARLRRQRKVHLMQNLRLRRRPPPIVHTYNCTLKPKKNYKLFLKKTVFFQQWVNQRCGTGMIR